MEMIIGGAFQGKAAYAKKRYPQIAWEEAGNLEEAELFKAEGILNFQDYIKKELSAGHEVTQLAKKLILQNPGVVLVSTEVGYGVVPVDAFEREYREAVGRVCTQLAAYSTRVTRVICGIGTVIRDA